MTVAVIYFLGETVYKNFPKFQAPKGIVHVISFGLAVIIFYTTIVNFSFANMLAVPILQGATSLIYGLSSIFALVEIYVD